MKEKEYAKYLGVLTDKTLHTYLEGYINYFNDKIFTSKL